MGCYIYWLFFIRAGIGRGEITMIAMLFYGAEFYYCESAYIVETCRIKITITYGGCYMLCIRLLNGLWYILTPK